LLVGGKVPVLRTLPRTGRYDITPGNILTGGILQYRMNIVPLDIISSHHSDSPIADAEFHQRSGVQLALEFS
jgi:hypothetical protein